MAEEKYLFDTDTITNILKPRPSRRLVRRLVNLPHAQQFISTITIGEIVYGAMKSSRAEHHIKNLECILLPNVNVLGFDAAAAFHYGEIRARQERAGRPLSHTDLQIAAITIANDCVLVTGNTRHFEMIVDFPVENWL